MTRGPAPDDSPRPLLTFPGEFDADAEYEIARGGHLRSVGVHLGKHGDYVVNFVKAETLEEEMGRLEKQGIHFYAEPAMIVVSRIGRWTIDVAVRWAVSQDYFLQLNSQPAASTTGTNAQLVLPADFDSMAEYDAQQRNYLEGAVAKLSNGLRYPLSFITPIRMRQAIEVDACYTGYRVSSSPR